jgi:hypothetical protein
MVVDFSYGGPTILQNPFVVLVLLPFLLVFLIIFAILQKSEVFGKGKKQIDSLVALVIALLFVSFANAVGIVVLLMPFLGASLAVIIVFMILWGSVWNNEVPKALKTTIGVIVSIAVVVAVIFITGAYDYLMNLFESDSSGILVNVIMIVVVIGAVVFALLGPGSKGDDKKKD